jgi:SAM-dependent methyltransferase
MIFTVVVICVLLFGFVVLIGAPYVPTLASQQREALQLLGLQKGQTILDLGSGDGRLLREAARQGYRAVGIEANPVLVLVSIIICLPYRKRVRIIWGDMWRVKWPATDGIYVFLHTRFMKKLDNKIIQQYSSKKINVVSYAFEIPGRKAVKRAKGLYLYVYK